MKLKYEDKISSFQPCPNKTLSIDTELVAYRFSHNPVESGDNFLPIAIKNISRITGKNRGYCCSAYGLSMFTTVEQLESKCKALEEFNPFIRQSLGSLWVGVKLDRSSGAITPPDKTGHFNLHESANFFGPNAIVEIGFIA